MNKQSSPFSLGRTEFIILMASLMSLNALAIDAMLPALGLISDDLRLSDPNDRQWIVTSYIAGMAIGSIIYGSLADRFGRKPILSVTISIYIIFGGLCAFTSDYNFLLIARFIQGLAASAMGVLTNSIIRDRFTGDAMARMMSTIMMIFMVVPTIAPMLGEVVLLFADWHYIFLMLSFSGLAMLFWVFMRLPETLDPKNVTPIETKAVLSAWRQVIFNRNAFGHVMASGFMMAPLFAFIASSQQIYVETFDAAELFVFLFALNASAMSFCSFINSRIVMRFGARRVSQSALIFYISVSAILLTTSAAGYSNLILFTVLLVPSMGMVGLTAANFGSIAMQPFGKIAGVASSFQNFARSCLSAGIGAAIGLQYDGTIMPFATGFFICGMISLLIIFWAEKGKLFRRIQTGVTSADLATNQQ